MNDNIATEHPSDSTHTMNRLAFPSLPPPDPDVVVPARREHYCATCGDVHYVRGERPVQERDQIVFPITPCPQCWPEAYGKVLMEQSGIPNLNRTFEQFNPNPAYPKLIEALTCAREWAAGAGAPILTLAGPVGTGKSHLAVAAGRAVVGRGMQVLYRSEGDLIDEMRKGIGNKTLDDLIETLRTVPYLIWDDLGASPVTESGWGDGKMDQIFDARWVGAEMGTLRTLVTTNLVTKQFHDRGLDRLASRLTDRTVGRSVNLQGAPDMRGEQR